MTHVSVKRNLGQDGRRLACIRRTGIRGFVCGACGKKGDGKSFSASLCATLFIIAVVMVCTQAVTLFAEIPAWVEQPNGYTLTYAQGTFNCDQRGHLQQRVNGHPDLEICFFMWHGAWIYEALESGKVGSAQMQPDGALQLSGLWGAREGTAPLRYALLLKPEKDQLAISLEVEKTGELKLKDGIWASLRTAVATNDTRMVYLKPINAVPVGKTIEGLFKQTFIGRETEPSLVFSGAGFCLLRSRIGENQHTFEVKLAKQRDFSLEKSMTVSVAFGFATMPKIIRPVVTCRAPLSLSARAPKEVPLYGKCAVEVTLAGTWDNPYDPDDIALDAAVTTASGRTYTQPGFFMVSHSHERDGIKDRMLPCDEGRWKVRLATTEPGPMRVKLTARDRSGGTVFEDLAPIQVTAANKQGKGFVRVSRFDPHYLAHDHGEGFVPIGHNLPIYRSSNAMSVRDILEKMSAAGENWNRWWLSKSGLGLEWEARLGWYRQAQAAKLDWLLEDAERLGFYYMLCMDTHQDFRGDGWKVNPFNAAQGGPCKTAGEWFTNESAKAFYRKRLRYTVARWGYSPHVLCWEFGNEFEGWADADQDSIIAWHREMAPVLAGLDPYNHLISTSWWSKTGPEECWQIPEMDIVQTHSYANNNLNVALETHDYCLTQWNGFQKPHLFVEFGIRSHNFSAEDDPTGRAIHNTIWAAVASGCCGAPMPWWHENYIEPKNLYFHFRAIRNFVDGLPFGTELWQQVKVAVPAAVMQPARPSERDAVVFPRSAFRKPTANVFTVSADSSVSNASELLALLHGGSHRDLVNPPTFEVTYPADGAFVVHVDRVSNAGLLRIFIDDRLALEKPLPCGEGHGKSWRYIEQWKLWESVYDTEVSVPVSAGVRRIRVENHGKDWVKVTRYVFSGCRTQERQEVVCYALAAPGAAIAWIQNNDSTWVNHAQRANEIRPFPAASYTLDGFADGAYAVEWWESWQGRLMRRETVRAAGGKLTLNPGPVATDIAVKIFPLKR